MSNLDKNFLLFLKISNYKTSLYNFNTSHIIFCCFSFWLLNFAYRVFKTSVYAIFHATAESCCMLSINPEYDTSSLYEIFKAAMKIFMKYMS